MRSFNAIEVAVGVSLGLSVLAVAVPAFVRNLSFSRLSEATDGIAQIGGHAIARATGRPCADAFPDTAPLTPASVPRGRPAVDPEPDPWQHPTWVALEFRPVAPGVPHSFSFAFDHSQKGEFAAIAHGDLDGNGTTSTFELHGRCKSEVASIVPGMIIDAELE
jgi:hypothetical protein